MVLKPDVLAAAIDAVSHQNDPRPRLLMSPRGKPLTQARARALAAGPGVVIVCGRFEGIDERVIEARNLEEISIGDYVLAGGEVAAMVLLEAVVRLIPGVLGAEASIGEESFENGLLEYPHYTRPQLFEGREIPAVLTSRRSRQGGKMAPRRGRKTDPRAPPRSPEIASGGAPPHRVIPAQAGIQAEFGDVRSAGWIPASGNDGVGAARAYLSERETP